VTTSVLPDVHPRDVFAVWATIVVVVCLVVLGVYVERRTAAIQTIEESSIRIEEALDGSAAGEAAAELRDIKSLLCTLPEFVGADQCGS